VDVLIIA